MTMKNYERRKRRWNTLNEVGMNSFNLGTEVYIFHQNHYHHHHVWNFQWLPKQGVSRLPCTFYNAEIHMHLAFYKQERRKNKWVIPPTNTEILLFNDIDAYIIPLSTCGNNMFLNANQNVMSETSRARKGVRRRCWREAKEGGCSTE